MSTSSTTSRSRSWTWCATACRRQPGASSARRPGRPATSKTWRCCFAVERALVRARVALLRGDATTLARDLGVADGSAAAPQCAPPLVLVCGLSGSGKNGRAVAGATPRRHADCARTSNTKRLHGLYDRRPRPRRWRRCMVGHHRAHPRLAELARTLLMTGIPAVVDAAALRRQTNALTPLTSTPRRAVRARRVRRARSKCCGERSRAASATAMTRPTPISPCSSCSGVRGAGRPRRGQPDACQPTATASLRNDAAAALPPRSRRRHRHPSSSLCPPLTMTALATIELCPRRRTGGHARRAARPGRRRHRLHPGATLDLASVGPVRCVMPRALRSGR